MLSFSRGSYFPVVCFIVLFELCFEHCTTINVGIEEEPNKCPQAWHCLKNTLAFTVSMVITVFGASYTFYRHACFFW